MNLFRILSIEWMKIRYYRTFWILLAVIAVCIPAFNYIVYDLTNNSFPKMNGQSILGSPFSFPEVWRTVNYFGGILVFMPAILIITLITNEFSYRTHRQNIIDGWSRGQFITAKLAEVLILSVFVTAISFGSCLYFGLISHSPKPLKLDWNQLQYIFYFFIQTVSYLMIALVISLLIRRAGLAMGVFFLYMIVEQFVVVLGRNKYQQKWVNYLPEEVTDRLIPQPFGQKLRSSAFVDDWQKQVPVFLVVAGLYIVIYLVVVSWRFRKADL